MRAVSVLSLGACAAIAGPALAADFGSAPPGDVSFLRRGYVHFGLDMVRQADRGTLEVGGAPVGGAAYTTDLTTAPSIEAGVQFSPNVSVAAYGTAPMSTANVGAGTIATYGVLGTETIGLYALLAKAHMAVGQPISPYVGAGVGYMHVFGTSDGAITGLRIQSAVGAVVSAGVEFGLTDHVGAFLDVKKFIIGTAATGTVGGFPAVARTRVDPWVVSGGIALSY